MKHLLYDIISPTSMGIRITPVDRQPVETSHLFEMQATSAESNVLNISASLGLKAKVLTKFVKDSSISRFIQHELSKRHIDYEGLSVAQGGPWGYRHQFNIADSGFGYRGPRVLNDRAGEVGRTLSSVDFDLKRIFAEEGSKFVHLSGLIASLSEDTSKLCVDIAEIAKANGSMIAFDLNYRASFWKNREAELKKNFHEIASRTDVLIGNEEDFQLCLGIKGPHAGGKDIQAQIEHFKLMMLEAKKVYPKVKVFATTLREVENANLHLWGAVVLYENEWVVIEPRPIQVYDRIGGGDGFVGGLLYGLLRGFTPDKLVQFAWATGALAATVKEDYATPSDEAMVWAIYEGNARVVR